MNKHLQTSDPKNSFSSEPDQTNQLNQSVLERSKKTYFMKSLPKNFSTCTKKIRIDSMSEKFQNADCLIF